MEKEKVDFSKQQDMTDEDRRIVTNAIFGKDDMTRSGSTELISKTLFDTLQEIDRMRDRIHILELKIHEFEQKEVFAITKKEFKETAERITQSRIGTLNNEIKELEKLMLHHRHPETDKL